jgi:hypothetical protein
VSASISDTITASDATLSLSGAAGPGPVSKRGLGEFKAYYASDIKLAINAAKPYCLNYLSGVGTFGTGVLLLGSGTIGPILVIAGALVGTVALPFCNATITRIQYDYLMAKDPPDPNIEQVAQPAHVSGVTFTACSTYSRSVQLDCRVLTADAQRLVTAARRVTAIADAASVTMNRYSTANAASNAAASTRQSTQLIALTAQSKQAVAALNTAGKQFATDLLNRHIDWRFSKQDTSRAVDAVLSLLNKLHLTRNEITPYAGSSLTPRTFDVLRDQNAL